MVSSKTVLGLAAVTAAAVGGVAFLLNDRTGTDGIATGTPDRMFPGLADRLNDITAVTVRRGGDVLTLNREGEGDAARWVIAEKDNYPAAIGKVRELLIGAAGLAPVEAKTSNPDLFGRLGLRDIDAAGSEARLVSLSANGEAVAAVLIGESGQSLSSTRRTVYARKPGETQAWMVEGDLRPETDPLAWLDEEITVLLNDRLREVVIYEPDGGTLTVERPDPDADLFTLRELPEGRALARQSELNQITYGLQYLDMVDVAALEPGVQGRLAARYTTYGGLQVDVRLVARDDTQWVALDARTVEPSTAVVEKALAEYKTWLETGETDPGAMETGIDRIKDAEGVAAEAAAINARTQGWIHAVPENKLRQFTRTLAGLLKPIEQDAGPLALPSGSDTDTRDGTTN